MTDSTRLAAEFGGPLPAGLAALTPAEQDQLCDAILAARKQQRRELAAATEKGLDFLPRLLRAPVRKAIFK